MKISRIELEGFRGFRQYADIRIPDGFLVIQGPNGSGKSTICDAVEFCLTGGISKYPVEKAAKETVADYFWWRGEGEANDHFVRVHFTAPDQTLFAVTRTPDSADKSPEEIRGALCNSDSPDDALRVLIETSLIRDESIAALSLDISETERYQRVQRALGAVQSRNLPERADKVARKADELNKINLTAEEAARKELTNVIARLSEAQATMIGDAELGRAEAELRAVISDAPATMAELISFVRVWLANYQAEAQSRLAAISQLLPLLAELAVVRTPEFLEQVRLAEASLSKATEHEIQTRQTLEAAQLAMDLEREADALAASLATLLAHGEDIGLQEGHCPLCDSALSDEKFKEAINRGRARLASRGGLAEASEQTLLKASASHAQALRELEIASRARTALQSRYASATQLQSQIDELLKRSNLTVDDLANANVSDRISNETRERSLYIDQRLRILESSRAFGQVRELEERVKALRIEVERIEAQVGKTQKALSSAKAIQHSITRTAGDMLDERLAMISPLLSELFLRLKPHGDWRNIEYRIRGDVRRFLSLAVGSDLNPQFVFSSGQRRITGLAFLLSVHLSRQWCNWQTLLLDDPVQHIDDYRALNLVEVLSAIRRDGRQIICAVEDIALANLLCRRLGSYEGQSGALLTLEPGPQGVARVRSAEEVPANPIRILDRISGSPPPQGLAQRG